MPPERGNKKGGPGRGNRKIPTAGRNPTNNTTSKKEDDKKEEEKPSRLPRLATGSAAPSYAAATSSSSARGRTSGTSSPLYAAPTSASSARGRSLGTSAPGTPTDVRGRSSVGSLPWVVGLATPAILTLGVENENMGEGVSEEEEKAEENSSQDVTLVRSKKEDEGQKKEKEKEPVVENKTAVLAKEEVPEAEVAKLIEEPATKKEDKSIESEASHVDEPVILLKVQLAIKEGSVDGENSNEEFPIKPKDESAKEVTSKAASSTEEPIISVKEQPTIKEESVDGMSLDKEFLIGPQPQKEPKDESTKKDTSKAGSPTDEPVISVKEQPTTKEESVEGGTSDESTNEDTSKTGSPTNVNTRAIIPRDQSNTPSLNQTVQQAKSAINRRSTGSLSDINNNKGNRGINTGLHALPPAPYDALGMYVPQLQVEESAITSDSSKSRTPSPPIPPSYGESRNAFAVETPASEPETPDEMGENFAITDASVTFSEPPELSPRVSEPAQSLEIIPVDLTVSALPSPEELIEEDSHPLFNAPPLETPTRFGILLTDSKEKVMTPEDTFELSLSLPLKKPLCADERNEIGRLQKEVVQLKLANDSWSALANVRGTELDGAMQNDGEMDTVVRSAKAERDEARQEFAMLKGEYYGLKGEIEGEKKEWEGKMRMAEEKLSKADERFEETQNELAKLSAEVVKLTAEKKGPDEKTQELANQVAELEAKLQERNTPLATDGKDSGLLTEEQCYERGLREREKLSERLSQVDGECEDARDELRRIRGELSDDSSKYQPVDSDPLREQINDLGDSAQRYKALAQSLERQLARQVAKPEDLEENNKELDNRVAELEVKHEKPAVPAVDMSCDEVRAENKRLKEEVISRLKERIAEVEKEYQRLEKDILPQQVKAFEELQAENEKLYVENKMCRENLIQVMNNVDRVIPDLKEKNFNLAKDNEHLEEDNQNLQAQLASRAPEAEDYAPIVGKLEESQAELRIVNKELRARVTKLESERQRWLKERDMAKDALRRKLPISQWDLKAEQLEDPEITKLKEKIAKFDEIERGYQQEYANLEARHKREMEEMEIEPLESAREKQGKLKWNWDKIAQLNRRGRVQRSPISPISLASSNGRRGDIPPSAGAMEVMFLRCELALAQLQAERARSGFVESDASRAIDITRAAQLMAEELNVDAWIGRAAFWRGIAEWMAGESMEASDYFDASARVKWTKPERERNRLDEWWDMVKRHDVDKNTRRRDSETRPLSAGFVLQRPAKKSKKGKATRRKQAKYVPPTETQEQDPESDLEPVLHSEEESEREPEHETKTRKKCRTQ